jgi:hypothetical protein
MARVWKRLVPGALAAILAAAGCRVDVAQPSRKDKPVATKAGASAKPAQPRKIERLRPPAGEVASLKGVVSIDAGYVVAAGAGNLVGNAGNTIVAAGGLNLIGFDGATLVGPDGATLVGPDGASLIGPDGATLIGNNGNTLVAAGGGNVIADGGLRLVGPDGATLVGADGASLIGPDGATLIGPDGASYALAQDSPGEELSPRSPGTGGSGAATPAADARTPGRVLPAAVMRVGLLDLRTGKPIPVGVDAAGEPVLTVYTDLAGGYELFVPAALRQYVRLVAEAPTSDDRRLAYDIVARPGGEDDPVDEDTAQVGRFLRGVFVSRLEDLMTKTEAQLVAELEPTKPDVAAAPGEPVRPAGDVVFANFVRPTLADFAKLSAAKGFDRMTTPELRARRHAFAQRATDILLADCEFETLSSAFYYNPSYVPPEGETPVMAYREAMKHIRLGVAALIDPAHPEVFGARLQALAPLPGAPPEAYVFRRPSDFNRFLVDRFLTARVANAGIGPNSDKERIAQVEGLLDKLGLLSEPDRLGRMQAAAKSIVYHMFEIFFFRGKTDETKRFAPAGEAVVDYLWGVDTGVPGAAKSRPADVPQGGL